MDALCSESPRNAVSRRPGDGDRARVRDVHVSLLSRREDHDATGLLVANGEVAHARTLGQDEHDQVLRVSSVDEADGSDEVALLGVGGEGRPPGQGGGDRAGERGVNLRQGAFSYKGRSSYLNAQLKRLGMLAAFLLLLLGGALFLQKRDLDTQEDAMRAAVAKETKKVFGKPLYKSDAIKKRVETQETSEGGFVPKMSAYEVFFELTSRIRPNVKLDLSRIEEAPPGRLESVDLASVVGEVVDRVGPTAERRHIALDVEVPVGVGVAGSRSQLLSLVRNLVENAVKYSDSGTTVAVRVSRDADDAVVEVVDRGIGIPAADLDRVFERFYRVDRARTRETGGSGLGLSIVRHVVQAHGGTVRLASTEGEGTTVTVRLPAGGAAARGRRWGTAEAPGTHSRTVLSMCRQTPAFVDCAPVESSQVCCAPSRATFHFTFLPLVSDMLSMRPFTPQS